LRDIADARAQQMQKPARSKGENDFGFRIADCGFEDWLTINPKSAIRNPKSEGTLTSCVFLHLLISVRLFSLPKTPAQHGDFFGALNMRARAGADTN
jgi:hypothetical protein